MPSTSKKQHNLMEMIAHDPKKAKELGVPQSVGQDFVAADKGKKLTVGGSGRTDLQKANKKETDHGQSKLFKEGGIMKSDMKEDTKMDVVQDKAMLKKAFKQHDAQEHKGGKGTKLALKSGGMCGGGKAMKKMAKGGGIEVKGKTKGRMV